MSCALVFDRIKSSVNGLESIFNCLSILFIFSIYDGKLAGSS